jgi:hypothetical protein
MGTALPLELKKPTRGKNQPRARGGPTKPILNRRPLNLPLSKRQFYRRHDLFSAL